MGGGWREEAILWLGEKALGPGCLDLNLLVLPLICCVILDKSLNLSVFVCKMKIMT
jgi:hypothetical protein